MIVVKGFNGLRDGKKVKIRHHDHEDVARTL